MIYCLFLLLADARRTKDREQSRKVEDGTYIGLQGGPEKVYKPAYCYNNFDLCPSTVIIWPMYTIGN